MKLVDLLPFALVLLAVPLATAAPKEPPAPPNIKSFAAPYPATGSIERLDPALDALIAPDAKIETLAEGFDWSEGPVWVAKQKSLLFSDIPPNTVYRWTEGKGITVFMKPSGYHGTRTDLKEPGTNGLVLDRKGNLLMAAHGDRRIARLASWSDPNGKQVAVAEKHDGKRFNSPNDLVVHSSGDLFFTDPPYGLAKLVDDPDKELPFQGVFRVDGKGKTTLLHDGLERPNGIGLAPDEKILYVANSHGPRPIWMAFDLKPDRSVANGRVFFDATELVAKTKREGAPDGFKVDKQGNLFATGPGGVLVLSSTGKHLGTILTGKPTANVGFGDDGSTLYITAQSLLLRIKTKTKGLGF
jgi:gluconolactonase